MIDLYFFPSPNTWKIAIMLEECALDYRVVPVDITDNEQFSDEFTSISPNNKVPAIVDHDAPWGVQTVFESGAILLYLAEQTGLFLTKAGPGRVRTLEWVFWQTSGLGPMAGQAHHFSRYAPEGQTYSAERFATECRRLYHVLDRQLAPREWIVNDYGIADMTCWGWVWFHPLHGQRLDDYPNIDNWFQRMSARPAVRAAQQLGLDLLDHDTRGVFTGPKFQVAPAWAAQNTYIS